MKLILLLAGMGILMMALGSCAAMPLLSGSQEMNIALKFDPALNGAPDQAVAVNSRFLASDNARATLTVQTSGSADQQFTFNPATGTVVVQVPLGQHTFIINTYDAAGNLLTTGKTSLNVGSGNNTVALTLSAPVSAVSGSVISIAAGQVLYFSLPPTASTFTCSCRTVTGANSCIFSVWGPLGNTIGTAAVNAVSLNPNFALVTSPYLIRADNTMGQPGAITIN